MNSEYCSLCKKVTTIRATITSQVSDHGNKDRPLTVKSYHCVCCGRFIRSEEENPSIEKLSECSFITRTKRNNLLRKN